MNQYSLTFFKIIKGYFIIRIKITKEGNYKYFIEKYRIIEYNI